MISSLLVNKVTLLSKVNGYAFIPISLHICIPGIISHGFWEEVIKASTLPLAISVKDTPDEFITPGLPLKQSVIVDISGGGLRFLSNHQYEPGSLIYINYCLLIKDKVKEYNLVGKVLAIKPSENRKGVYEHRVQYLNIGNEEREEIIRYIFEEERKHRSSKR